MTRVNRWVVGDLHLYHRAIIHFMKRPYSNEIDMTEDIIKKLNNEIKPDDIVYLNGDIVWNTHGPYIIDRINGKKIIIFGNHDRQRQKYEKCKSVIALYEEVIVRIGGRDVRISHYPYRPSAYRLAISKIKCFFGLKAELKHLDKRPYDDGKWLVHAHTHQKEMIRDNMICVSWDTVKKPISFSEIESIIQKLENERAK